MQSAVDSAPYLDYLHCIFCNTRYSNCTFIASILYLLPQNLIKIVFLSFNYYKPIRHITITTI